MASVYAGLVYQAHHVGQSAPTTFNWDLPAIAIGVPVGIIATYWVSSPIIVGAAIVAGLVALGTYAVSTSKASDWTDTPPGGPTTSPGEVAGDAALYGAIAMILIGIAKHLGAG